MWQRLIERFVPLREDEPSGLDRLDGVGRVRCRALPREPHALLGAQEISGHTTLRHDPETW